MNMIIKEGDNLPSGEYVLTDRNKVENAKSNVPFGSSDRMILIEYDRIAGRVVKDEEVLPPQSLWQIEQQHMNKPIEQFSDAELLTVIRRAENTNIPGSLYQRANTEWQIRHQQKMLDITEKNRNGIFFEVGGDMTNHGVIHTAEDATVDIAVAGNYSSNNKTKIIQSSPVTSNKQWYEKPLGIVIIGIVIAIISGGFIYFLGWN